MEKRKRNPRVYRKTFKNRKSDDTNVQKTISEIEDKLKDSIQPEIVKGLNAFERRLVHRHFDHNDQVQTRTYRDGNDFTLYVYPVGNIEKLAKEKAEQAMATGEPVDLPPMGSYERYIVHAVLKEMEGIETASQGEGQERHVQIISKRFGRTLKKIAKKIKLF